MKYILPVLCVFLFNCTPIKQTDSRNNVNESRILKKKQRVPMLDVVLYADVLENGNYIIQDSLEVPEPKQGKIPFFKTMYSKMLYPAEARNKGVEGNVVLGISVNKEGSVTNVSVVKSDSELLNNSALSAFKYAETRGYNPLLIRGKAVSYRFEMPVRFMLN